MKAPPLDDTHDLLLPPPVGRILGGPMTRRLPPAGDNVESSRLQAQHSKGWALHAGMPVSGQRTWTAL